MTVRMSGTETTACQRQSIGLMITAAALWATVGLADSGIKAEGIGTEVTGLVRTLLGALALSALALLLRLPLRAGGAARSRFPLAAAGAFGLCCAVFQITLFEAFRHVGISVTVAVTVCLPPVLLACGEVLWRARWPSLMMVIAVASAAAGVTLVQVLPNGGAGAGGVDLRGGALLLLASLAFCGVTLASRCMVSRLNCVWATAAGLGMAAVALFLQIAVVGVAALEQLALLDGADLALLGYIGIAATGGAYLAFVTGLKLASSASVALVATMTEPVFAAVLAALLVGEHITALQVAGILLLLSAMVALARGATSHLPAA